MSTGPISPSILTANNVAYWSGLWYVASFVEKTRVFWKVKLLGETYHPNNLAGIAAGTVAEGLLDLWLPGGKMLKIGMYPFLIGSRIYDLFLQENKFQQACNEWKDAVYGVQPVYHEFKLVEKSFLTYLFSRYTLTEWKIGLLNLETRIKRIFWETVQVIVQTYYLINRIIDVIEVISFDIDKIKRICEEHFREGVVHGSKCMNALIGYKHTILQRLSSKSSNLHRGLRHLGIDPRAVKEKVVSFYDFTEPKMDAFNSISEYIGSYFISFFGTAGSQGAKALGYQKEYHKYIYNPYLDSNNPLSEAHTYLESKVALPKQSITLQNPPNRKKRSIAPLYKKPHPPEKTPPSVHQSYNKQASRPRSAMTLAVAAN